MELSKLLTPDRIRVPLLASNKIEVITELVDLLHATGALSDRDAALAAVLSRESERSTGIGYGLAIPHAKSSGVRRLVMAAGKPATPVDFQSVDGRPVNFAVLLISPPDQTSAHIQALAKISRLMNIDDFRAAVTAAQSGDELAQAVIAAELAEQSGS
jgi:fructose-specific phosphotransferase system IIA component